MWRARSGRSLHCRSGRLLGRTVSSLPSNAPHGSQVNSNRMTPAAASSASNSLAVKRSRTITAPTRGVVLRKTDMSICVPSSSGKTAAGATPGVAFSAVTQNLLQSATLFRVSPHQPYDAHDLRLYRPAKYPEEHALRCDTLRFLLVHALHKRPIMPLSLLAFLSNPSRGPRRPPGRRSRSPGNSGRDPTGATAGPFPHPSSAAVR